MKRGMLGIVLAAGCGAAVVPEGTDTTTSTATTGAPATTAMLDSTAPPDPSTSSSDASASTSTDGYELPKLDVAGPDVGSVIIETCSAGAELGDFTVVTPSGPFAATHAWWAWNYCCIAEPWLVLAAAPELEIADHTIITPHVMVLLVGTWENEDPYVGPWDASLRDVASSDFGDAISGLDLLEPLDPDLPTDPMPSFVATVAIDGADWTIDGNVSAPYCAAIEYPGCPCE